MYACTLDTATPHSTATWWRKRDESSTVPDPNICEGLIPDALIAAYVTTSTGFVTRM